MQNTRYFCDICKKEIKVSEIKIMSFDEKLHDLCPTCYRNFKVFINKQKGEMANDN